jgi:hypothetical protein
VLLRQLISMQISHGSCAQLGERQCLGYEVVGSRAGLERIAMEGLRALPASVGYLSGWGSRGSEPADAWHCHGGRGHAERRRAAAESGDGDVVAIVGDQTDE